MFFQFNQLYHSTSHTHAVYGKHVQASRSLIKSGPSPSVANMATRQARRPRAIELGSGVGLSAYVRLHFASPNSKAKHLRTLSLSLAAQGWSVLATDTPTVVNTVLRPNILRNTQYTRLPGNVQVRALDWTVPPEGWTWTDPLMVADHLPNSESRNEFQEVGGDELLGPPFDLILTSDTVYTPSLVTPLLRTLKHLICLSILSPSTASSSMDLKSRSKQKKSHPPLYLALEARDPDQIASFFSEARNTWGLTAQRIPAPRVRRAMTRAGLGDWKREDWEGVEIWRMHLLDSDSKDDEAPNAVS